VTAFRPLLIWVLCALLGGAGQPLRQPAPCEAGGTAGCCAPEGCCCAPQAQQECGCKTPAPAPAPVPPTPKSPIGLEQPQPLPPAAAAPAPAPPRLDPAAGNARPPVLLAERSRQEALSVWRL
jgi:hypothetical protein